MDLRGHLDLLLLATLARTGPAHGYAVISALRDQSAGTFDLAEGTVYPALHRLERDGHVVSRWSHDTARRRRVYELTAAGREALVVREREWRVFARAVGQVARLDPALFLPWAGARIAGLGPAPVGAAWVRAGGAGVTGPAVGAAWVRAGVPA